VRGVWRVTSKAKIEDEIRALKGRMEECKRHVKDHMSKPDALCAATLQLREMNTRLSELQSRLKKSSR
jgi:hypothetical protein